LSAGVRRCDNATVRDRARSLAIGIALTPLTVLGLVAVFTHGTVEVVLAGVGLALSTIAVVSIYVLERPLPRRSPQRAIGMESGAIGTESASGDTAPNEHAVDLDLGVRWDRESSDAWFIHRDGGAALILKPDRDDADRRLVVLVWAPCTAARVGPPNADTRHEHRLYFRGLRECAWAAEVRESSWIADGQRHFVIVTKEETIEVVAPDVVVHRVDRVRLAASSGDEARH
jgi:hypothetical protein